MCESGSEREMEQCFFSTWLPSLLVLFVDKTKYSCHIVRGKEEEASGGEEGEKTGKLGERE